MDKTLRSRIRTIGWLRLYDSGLVVASAVSVVASCVGIVIGGHAMKAAGADGDGLEGFWFVVGLAFLPVTVPALWCSIVAVRIRRRGPRTAAALLLFSAVTGAPIWLFAGLASLLLGSGAG
ncbi:MAG TPA: hypothetical protein VFE15_04270 [Marmoricola sp.]|nr:hypothetical protein [Marmoricola sp.]